MEPEPMTADPTTTKPLIDYDFLIRQACDIIAYGRTYNHHEFVAKGSELLAYWLERKERSEQR
jgi:hypothetical protein